MNFVPEGYARAFYAELLSTHHDGGAWRKEDKIKKYRDIQGKLLPYIKGKSRKVENRQWVPVDNAEGWQYIRGQARSDRNPNGTIPAVVLARMELLNAMWNDIQHHHDEFGWDDYFLAARLLAETIMFFSGVPVPPEVRGIYEGAAPPGSSPAQPRAGGTTPPPAQTAIFTTSSKSPDGLQWMKIPTGIVIIGYTGTETTLVIPDSIDGHPVVEIAPEAFCDSKLERVEFPESLKKIGHGAFYPCGNLQVISLPPNLEFIGDYAFQGCNLQSLSLPPSLKSVGYYAFNDNAQLKAVYLSRNTQLDSEVFYEDTAVEYYD
ncbi:MAG: leucine-rich repeat domain-containing protein [Spirochaetaceae bacterium]|jgi:hypothetical protein|nr:leucine-rich repeat domain-containing protein [Spirochaetaceae bacterium]